MATTQNIPITQLRNHRRQAEMFGSPNEFEIKTLANDIKTRGLQVPIDVVPLDDNTYQIVCGHCRVLAAGLLGWLEIPAVIRNDLADAGQEAIEKHLIADNLNRRQLTPLAIARCAWRLRELIYGNVFDELPHHQQDEVYHHTRDRVAHLLGVSGRQVSRLLSTLEAPLAVQRAFDLRQISANDAARVAGKPAEVQAQIASEIEAGGDAKAIIQKHFSSRREPTSQEKIYGKLVRTLRDALEVFEDHFDGLRAVDPVPEVEQIIADGIVLLEDLEDHVATRHDEQAAALAEKLNSSGLLTGSTSMGSASASTQAPLHPADDLISCN